MAFNSMPAILENDNVDQINQFIDLSTRIARFGKSIGISIVPFRDPQLPYFSRLASAQKKSILTDLQNFGDICELTVQSGASLRDNGQLIWNCLRKFNLRPTSDLFQFIPDGNVVEIHSTENKQIFCSFSFYHCCSYSLEELHSFPWNQLYSRDEESNEYLIGIAAAMFRGELKGVVPMTVKPHKIRELYSQQGFEIEAQMKYLAPLYGDTSGQIEAHILIEDRHIANKYPSTAKVIPLDFA